MPLTRDALAAYLVDTHGLGDDDLWDEAPLFSSHQLDSFAMVELIVWIEREAGIRVHTADVTLDNLDSIAKIMEFVARRQAAGPAGRAVEAK